jgi:hypothetical protein
MRNKDYWFWGSTLISNLSTSEQFTEADMRVYKGAMDSVDNPMELWRLVYSLREFNNKGLMLVDFSTMALEKALEDDYSQEDFDKIAAEISAGFFSKGGKRSYGEPFPEDVELKAALEKTIQKYSVGSLKIKIFLQRELTQVNASIERAITEEEEI